LARKFWGYGRDSRDERLAACTVEPELRGVIVGRSWVGTDIDCVVGGAAGVPFDAGLDGGRVERAGAGAAGGGVGVGVGVWGLGSGFGVEEHL
jgi:hypothetical protein